MLGIGSFGLIREAVYIPAARAFKAKHSFDNLSISDEPVPSYLHTSDGTVVSLFESGNLETFAVKTLDKLQEKVVRNILPNEVLNLTRMQQARNIEDEHVKCGKKGESSVRLYAVYEEDDQVHLVLENCKGATLAELIRDEDVDDDSIELTEVPMEKPDMLDNERSIKRVMRQLLYSVRRMHELGIAHRDLKLENVMLTAGGKNG